MDLFVLFDLKWLVDVHGWLLSGALEFAVPATLIFFCAIHFTVCWRKSFFFNYNQHALNLTASYR